MRRLADIVEIVAAHDGRSEEDAALLFQQMRGSVARGVVLPSGRTSAGRTAAALFDREAAAKLALAATLIDFGIGGPEMRPILASLDRTADRPRTPNVAFHSNGFAEALDGLARGERGWRVEVVVLRGTEGRTFSTYILAPDAEPAGEVVERIVANYRAARGERVVATILIDLADRIPPALLTEG
ncbi:hypothetical protein [Roseomonas rosulenta]|uniref:hypothetical protein n=1 Tax=Roseomonas rosulenta TaxID=2748667 RepID=UPI0018E02B5D|nr:hypothetical protein [Roseomonas rosulenta]